MSSQSNPNSISPSEKHNSRRNFLQNGIASTAATAATLSVSSRLAADDQLAVHTSESTPSDSREPIRMALIGCGGRGTGALNDSMSINDNVKLVALADLKLQKCENTRRAMSGRHGAKVDVADNKMYEGLDAYKRILEDPDVDLVLLTTSPGFRPYHIAEAVDAGKHVFAEKPTCVDPAGFRICLAAHDRAVANGTAIVTGTQYRRQTNYVQAVEQIRSGAIGDIVSATTRYCSNSIWFKNRQPGMSELDYQLDNWMHFIWLSGDQITEQAVHNIDTLNWIMGSPPETAYGSGGRFTRPETSEMWDSMSIDYQYPGDRILSFMCRQIPRTKGDNGSVIYGTEATMHIAAMSGGSRIVDRKGNEVWSAKGSISDAYRQEHKDLVDSIVTGKPIVELKDTAESSLTAVMGRLAAYTGQRVTWDFVTEKSKLNLFPKNLDADSFPPSSGHAIPGQTPLV
ncbi:Gfo/Idh/MocA family protein [Aporhodopirellula aestuarii]|uniref:Gfo/Idh/MocA family oxidoreductase n=1 Tax=Aporhodopirellula aestuarii TaxID=2950107 RepID=A0ABT0U8T8_9BACT|nr:Gfo/Idh/MocA family oxidoreductase [Aporhodopirellula aestuarii]MCM2373377.1 Gfo/Idh/MocA family oxidoreductase [Aporhodopirellula aestuarii]